MYIFAIKISGRTFCRRGVVVLYSHFLTSKLFDHKNVASSELTSARFVCADVSLCSKLYYLVWATVNACVCVFCVKLWIDMEQLQNAGPLLKLMFFNAVARRLVREGKYIKRVARRSQGRYIKSYSL